MISGALYMFSCKSQGEVDNGKREVSEDCIVGDLLSGLEVETLFLTTVRILQRASL
jgi:hypothetical protein